MLVSTSMCWEHGTPQLHDMVVPVFGTLPDFALCIVTSGCSSILYHTIN